MILGALAWIVILAHGPNEINETNRVEAYRLVQDFYQKELGIRLTLEAERDEPNGCLPSLDAVTSLTCWDYWLLRLSATLRSTVATTVIMPPAEQAGKLYFAGLSNTRGLGSPHKKPLAVNWCGDKPRSCALVLAHEIGHLLGAQHVGGAPNFMDQAAGKYADQSWAISNITRVQIRRHLKRVKLWQISKR